MTTFDITKKGILFDIEKIINTSQRSMIKTGIVFMLDKSNFPNSWEDFGILTKSWARIIDQMIKYAPKPQLKFLVGIDIPTLILQEQPISFNWRKYENPEFILDCELLNTWLSGYSIHDPSKKTQFIDLVLPKKLFSPTNDFCIQLDDYKDIDNKGLPGSYVQYFIPLGQIIEMKFELE